ALQEIEREGGDPQPPSERPGEVRRADVAASDLADVDAIRAADEEREGDGSEEVGENDPDERRAGAERFAGHGIRRCHRPPETTGLRRFDPESIWGGALPDFCFSLPTWVL